ncbi:MAG TPA: hypothetical protein VGK04_11770 [Thermoanaerobaculia bacterium]|jgi:hypothetical protein
MAVYGALRSPARASVSSAMIAAAARGDLWYDEIWSLHFAGMASAPLDIAHFHHDNNHVLNTVYLFLVRTQPLLYVDSLLAVVCGVLSVLVAGWIVREWGRIEALSAMLLTGIAYPRLCPGNVLRAAVVRDHPPHTES